MKDKKLKEEDEKKKRRDIGMKRRYEEERSFRIYGIMEIDVGVFLI